MSDEFNWDLDIEDALDLDFPGWQPREGDKVTGTVLNVTMSEPGQYGSYPIYSIATATGGTSIHAFHTVLRKAMSSVEPGDFIGIKYKGEVRGADFTYADYNVIVQKAGGRLTGKSVTAVSGGEKKALPEPAGWETPEATPQQRAAINTLREQGGGDPIDWATSTVSEAEAAQMIKELQG